MRKADGNLNSVDFFFSLGEILRVNEVKWIKKLEKKTVKRQKFKKKQRFK